MGSALAEGLRKDSNSRSVIIWDADPKKLAGFQPSELAQSNVDLVQKTNHVILAVKPQQLSEVIDEIKPHLKEESLVVSIAAGISTAWLEERLGSNVHVIRAMPNLAAKNGKSTTVICKGSHAEEMELISVKAWFDAVGPGKVEIITENLMDAATAVSGSGPAYFFYLMEQMVETAKELGFSEKQARVLVEATAEGASSLAMGRDPSVLRAEVTSKGGTTEAALQVFEKQRLKEILREGILAAARRSKELSK